VQTDDKRFDTGEPVTIIPYFNCGKCIACRMGKPNCCEHINVFGVHINGAMQEYVTVPSYSYQKYGRGLSKVDWRRSNCDSIIKLLYETIRANNPRVKFGISPFGVWRNIDKDPIGSNTRAGQTNYDDLYADILLWLQKGWIDYVVPQLYWERKHKLCDYDTLLDWWNQHVYGKQLYIGHAIYRAGTSTAWRNKNELPDQIKNLRNYSTTEGSAYFSSIDLEKNINGWADSLRLDYYALPALVPPMKWIDSTPPAKPTIEKLKNNSFQIIYSGKEKIKGFAVFVLPPNISEKKEYATLIKVLVADTKINFDRTKTIAAKSDRIFISSIDLNNNISECLIKYLLKKSRHLRKSILRQAKQDIPNIHLMSSLNSQFLSCKQAL